jgi:phage replication O-like protein O
VLGLADVQIEHGFTKLANELLEQMALTKLSPIQYRIVFVIWRYTYGFHRKEHQCSLSFLSKATSYDQRQIQRELQKLEQRKIIAQKVQKGKPRVISFNKNYDEWLEDGTIGSSTIGNSTKGTIGKVTKGTIGSSTKEERYKDIKDINKEEEDATVNQILDLLQKAEIVKPSDINEFLREDLNDVMDNFGFENPSEMIVAAIKESARGNGKTWLFVYNKLRRWKKEGIKSITDLEHFQMNIKSHKKQNNIDWNELEEEFENG